MQSAVLGVTVLPEWIQAEGGEAVLDRLQAAGVNAVATSPYVMRPVADGSGSREPPIDAGAGGVRLLDRALWGRRELWVETAPSFPADSARYRGLRYQPAPPTALTEAEGPKVAAFIRAARSRGMTVHLQVQAAIPPGYRVQFGGPAPDDEPLLPDGTALANRVDRNASLASPHIRSYLAALLADLAAQYPEAHAIRIDWPEYPPYSLDAIFLDCSGHACAAATRLGLDEARMRRDSAALRAALPSLAACGPNAARDTLLRLLARHPGFADLLWLKRQLVRDLLATARAALPAGMQLVPQAFPPPWNLVSGFDYAEAAPFSAAIGCKLYTMHWPMMLRSYAETLGGGDTLARLLPALLDTGGPAPAGLADLRYPEPEEPHPAGDAAMARKLRTAQAEAGRCPVHAFAHAYGPTEDVLRRLRVAREAAPAGAWINRYGYLGDGKLAGMRG